MRTDRFPPLNGPSKLELHGRKILLGVCGGIAAYKAVELARLLVKNGARVQVVMTKAATKFVAPLTFEAITARNVFVEMFPAPGEVSPWHTELATWPDLAVVAPATANHMARLAAGFADDLLSTIMLTLEKPKVLAPAMNHRMWANAATQENLVTLKRRGFRVVMPEEGQMARPGEEDGIGRLAEPQTIYRELYHILSAPQDLRGVRVLVTAGRTEESWDPVRMLTNRASGRMGFALAEEARERGADVILIHGPTDVIPPTGVKIRKITTASEMALAVKQEIHNARIVLMSAAVADYTFAETVSHKIKKGDPTQEIKLVPTEDILKTIAGKKGDRIIVGFALETENLLENSLKKLREKHLDIVVANNPLTPGGGFAGETNQVLIIHRNGRVHDLPLQSKREIAREILNAVIHIYRNPEPEPEIEPEDDIEDLTDHLYQDLDSDLDLEVESEKHETPPAPVQQQKPAPKPQIPVVEKKIEQKHGSLTPHQKPFPRQHPVVVEKKVEPKPQLPIIQPEVKEEVPLTPDSIEGSSVPAESVQLHTKRSGKNRRGGRRGAKARAAKRLAMANASGSGETIPNEVVSHETVPAPVNVVETRPEPVVHVTHIHETSEVRAEVVAETPKKTERKKPSRPKKSKPKSNQETLPAVTPENPVVPEVEIPTEAVAVKKKSSRRPANKKKKKPTEE